MIKSGAVLFRLLRRTYRMTYTDPWHVLDFRDPWPMIVVMWHNRLAILTNYFPREKAARVAAMASASRDGEFAAQALRTFGFQVVRGSTSRGGYEGMNEMRRLLGGDTSVALTIDGPRGPRYHAHPGAVILGEKTGRAIATMGFNAPRRWELHGWDRTQIPKPFSRVQVIFGEPFTIPPDLTPEQRTAQCLRVQEKLLAITDDTRR